MVKLYEGCWGKRRDGEIVGPFRFGGGGDFPFADANGCTYTVDGGYYHHGRVSQADIIEAYPHDPRVKTQEPLLFNLTTREQWRWWFAGQAASSSHGVSVVSCVAFADELIEQLEKGKEDE